MLPPPASAPTGTRYYTYRPGINGSRLKLRPNQALRFRAGKGYYAGPRMIPRPAPPAPAAHPVPPYRPAPAPPVDPYAPQSASAIDTRAGQIAQSQLTPQQDEIRRQQDLAAKQAAAQEAAIQGFQGAAAGLLAGIGPAISGAYSTAAKDQSAFGAAVGGQVGQDIQNAEGAGQSFADSQGQSGGSSISPGDQSQVMGDLGGAIPATALSNEGAAAAAWGAVQPAIALNAGREELDARMAQARQDNDGYAQQLIQLAATYPGLKAQALQQLNQYELDKANYREQLRTDSASIASQKRQDALSARSERAQEKVAGINASNDAQTLRLRWAGLQFQSEKALLSARSAAAKGRRPSASLSKVYGHVVDANGRAITDADGNQIPVVKTASSAVTPKQKGLVNRAKATSKANVDAFNFATKLLGAPVKAPKGSKGAYIASGKYANIPQGKPGAVFPPSYPGGPHTTNRPGRASRSGGANDYADAQTKVWAEIDGDGLMSRYGYSRQQVMTIVNRALARAGWKRK